MSERDGPQVVLLDAGVAPLGRRGVGRLPSRSWDVHADHVPEVTLQRPTVVVQGACGGGLGYRFRFHHGHGDRGGLLRAAAVRHGAEREKTRIRDHLRSITHPKPTESSSRVPRSFWDLQVLWDVCWLNVLSEPCHVFLQVNWKLKWKLLFHKQRNILKG